MFNAFKYTKQLEEVGFSREQAETQLQVMAEFIEGDLATKADLNTLETNLKQETTTLRQDIETLGISLRQDMANLQTYMENKIQQLEYRIIIKLGTLLIIGFTTMLTLMKFWIGH